MSARELFPPGAVVAALLALAGLGLAAEPEKTLWRPYYISPRPAPQHLSLASDWQLGYRDRAIENLNELERGVRWIRTAAPSTVQWALYRAGELPHPYEHLNSKQYEWVDQKVWYYRRSFDLPASARGSYVFLCFDGVDYYSRVWLNGVLLGRHEGMFGGPAAEISESARYGSSNEVLVEVKAGNFGVKKTFDSHATGTVIKPWVLAGGVGAEAFFPLGMWRAARVEVVPRTHLERPFLVTRQASEKEARLDLTVEVLSGMQSLETELHPWQGTQLRTFRDAWTSRPVTGYTLEVELRDRDSARPALRHSHPLEIYEGRNWFRQAIQVPEPKLWWPNGTGEPHLYGVRLALLHEGHAVDTLEFDYGIRTIRTVATAGPRTADRWANWQFEVNGRRLFVKGVNWMPADLLLDLPRERYEWLLGLARSAGVQLLRIWGAGLLETEEFYSVANEFGLMVWQDFPIANQETPLWPQDVWEAQVLQTIFRLRNHPSLALYCGGNEFNPYSLGNATAIGILERSVADFDGTRAFRRTSPDAGSIHTYPDMDPTWYSKLYRLVPYVSETGMHNLPEPRSILEVVDQREFEKPLSNLYSEAFAATHPDFRHHFVEFQATRVPRMVSRASQIDDMSAPTLESLADASQIGAGEFYQIVSEAMQGNYPVTAGLMPWVFKRPWPVVAIMLVDGFGQPTAPYYFLKRTYEPTHVMVKLPELLWAAGEKVPITAQVSHSGAAGVAGLTASVEVFDDRFRSRWREQQTLTVQPGPSVQTLNLGDFAIPPALEERFFFVVAELRQMGDGLVSRSVYWPRCLRRLADPAFRAKYRESPQPALAFEHGPWLKRQVEAVRTTLNLELVSVRRLEGERARLQARVRNTGQNPGFLVHLDIDGVKRAFHAADNFFWLAPDETRLIDLEVLWRESPAGRRPTLTIRAWNAEERQAAIP